MQPIYLLVDEKTDGIVAALHDPVIANHLRRGILDLRLQWSHAPYDPKKSDGSGFRRGEFFTLGKEARTGALEEKRSLARVRIPAFELWRSLVVGQIQKGALYYEDIDALLADELEKSSREKLSEGLQPLTGTSGKSPAEVYSYVSLYTKERAQAKLALFALAEDFSQKINVCEDESACKALCGDMQRAFTTLRPS